MQLAQDVMARPPTPQLTAEADDLVREVRKHSLPSFHRCSCEDCEEALNFAALAVRELCVLVVCSGCMMSDVRFEAAIGKHLGGRWAGIAAPIASGLQCHCPVGWKLYGIQASSAKDI